MIQLTRDISLKQREWRNDPSIHAWTRQNGLISLDEHDRWLERIKVDRSIMMFGILALNIIEQDIHPNVGTCGLTSISYEHGTAEFSLLIGPEFQGRGYGKLALIELLKYGFKNLRLNCIWGESFDGNPALKMFERVGFCSEGRVRQRYFKHGQHIDAHLVSILASEARAQSWWN